MQRYLQPKELFYGLLSVVYGLMLLLIQPQEPAVFFLWLLSLILMVIRLRFQWMSRYIYIDLLGYILLILLNPLAIYLVIPSLLLSVYEGKFWALSVLLVVLFATIPSVLAWGIFVFLSLFSGGLLYSWKLYKEFAIREIDSLRERRYHLEREHDALLSSQDELARFSVLSERDRIAQKLHDDLGHELTGALLALRAYEATVKEAQDHPSFQAFRTRVEGAVDSLKETVQATRPDERYGLERFKTLLERFDFAPLEYKLSPVLAPVNELHWHALCSVLKEALTNVQKHSHATRVSVQLSVEDTIIRLSVKNDQAKPPAIKSGVGLNYMRRRVEALGGTLSIRKDYHFIVICVLPLVLEEGL